MIKSQIKSDYTPALDKIAAPNLCIYSGNSNGDVTKQLAATILWDRKTHGGGCENPLIVVAREQSKFILYSKL
jgi:hypothetical protein